MSKLLLLMGLAGAQEPVSQPSSDLASLGTSLVFEPGPALQPTEALRGWLEQMRVEKSWIKIPVRFRFSDEHRADFSEVYLGGWAPPASDAIALNIDQTAAPYDIVERVRSSCSWGDLECAVWLVGHWGANVGTHDPSAPTFTVREVLGTVNPHDAPSTLRAHLGHPAPLPGPPETPTGFGPVTATPQLLEWLDVQHAAGALIRLPVRLQFADEGRLALGPAHICGWEQPGSNTVQLALDDSALGISLLDRARDRCPAGESACALWLVGSWGPLVGPMDPAEPTLAVREVQGLVDRGAKNEDLTVERIEAGP